MIFVKKAEETNEGYGKRPENRDINELLKLGVVVIDKPQGPSSHEVCAFVRKILKLKKAGHSGTLDPNVSGVLPVCLERATKLTGILSSGSKEYVGVIHFHKELNEEKIGEIFKKFVGKITQIPPLRSAVKRVKRLREIYYLTPLEIEGRNVLFKVGCEAGTYIRKLCFDMGREAKCGANLIELRRTRVGKLSEKNAITLQKLSDAYWLWKEKEDENLLKEFILPIEGAIELKKAWISDSAIEAVCSGADLALPGLVKFEGNIKKEENIAVTSLKDELVCIGVSKMDAEEIMKKEGGIIAKTLRVVLEKGTYPRCWK